MTNASPADQSARPEWFKSTYSAAQNECVEVARSTDTTSVRDSKDLAVGHLTVPAAVFATFVGAVRAGSL